MKSAEAIKEAKKIVERLKSEWPQERWQYDVCLDIQQEIAKALRRVHDEAIEEALNGGKKDG